MYQARLRLFCSLAVLLVTMMLGLIAQQVGISAQGANPNELLVFEVNRLVTTADRGFPKNDPPRAEANGNWMTPINFAEGTFYYRVQVRSQPQPQDMQIQFCVWQDSFTLETCGTLATVRGVAETVVTWQQPIAAMWKLNGRSIEWNRPRQRYGIAIKNSQGLPVSDYEGWNWNGENPAAWYPLDVRITVVVVAKDHTFSGWQNYINGAATATPTQAASPTMTASPMPTATRTPVPTQTMTNTPVPSSTATLMPTITLTPTRTRTEQTTATPTATATPTVPATATETIQPTATVAISPTPPTGAGGDYPIFLPLITR